MQHFFNLDLAATGLGMVHFGQEERRAYVPPAEAVELVARGSLPAKTRERVLQIERLFS